MKDEPRHQGVSFAKAAAVRAEQRRTCSEVHQRCKCRLLDLTDMSSVRTFVASSPLNVKENDHMLPVILVNNAGIMGDVVPSVDNQQTSEVANGGNDVQLLTNHYGHFLLTRLLLPMMGPTSQVIIVGSRAHYLGSLRIQQADGTEINSDEIEQANGGFGHLSALPVWLGQSWYARYARSKLCNVLFAAELRRRYPDGPGCLVVSPGLVNTNLFAGLPSVLREPLTLVARTCFQTSEEGASHILHGVTVALDSAANDTPPPLYWHCGEPQRPSFAAEDLDIARAVWRSSEAFVGL